MAQTAASDDRCIALTADGERCGRSAGEDDFCYQHDDSDPTVSDAEQPEAEESSEKQRSGERLKEQEATEQEREGSTEADREGSTGEDLEGSTGEDLEGSTGEETRSDEVDPELDEVEVTADVDDEQIEGILSIRRTVKSTASDLVGHPFDGVSEITADDDGWQAVVEVVEREAVPDTQDVIGRYRIDLNADGTVVGYRRIDRYRRGDTTSFE
ncbi:gas vesicle protein GvpO, halophile-type [Halovivax limisalsi]|uniref:gas vesicle protein GvpO, halophile-type n=1 Tax=Halovivax limisalsi TaxID=1453760 RepID=UPI001FFCE0FF|nr:gas vesicle protein GvpO [Halovivax limisalsi]